MAWSYEDLRGCFYISRLPAGRARLQCFDELFLKSDLGLKGDDKCYVGSVVIPMGAKNAVGLCQYLHRRFVLLLEGGPQPCPVASGSMGVQGSPPLREIRKDRPTPPRDSAIESLARFGQIYVDDVDIAEVVTMEFLTDMAAICEDSRELNSWQTFGRETYDFWNGPRADDKSGVRRDLVTRLGISVDGLVGRWGTTGKKVGGVLNLTTTFLSLTQLGHGTIRSARVIGPLCFNVEKSFRVS